MFIVHSCAPPVLPSVVSIKFTETDYHDSEYSGQIEVSVERSPEIGLATPIVIQVIPVDYNTVNNTGFSFPNDFPQVPPFDPRAPVIGKHMQCRVVEKY